VSQKWQITLSPRYDTYVGRTDLAVDLVTPGSKNLSSLLPANNGVRRSFFRIMKNIEAECPLVFTEIKKSPRDIMWAIMHGKKQIGTVMVSYAMDKAKNPTWTDARIKVKDQSRTTEDSQWVGDVRRWLTDALTNPGVNAYSFHLKTVDFLNKIADVRLPRFLAGLNGSTLKQQSYYWLVDDGYLGEILKLEHIYSKFGMDLEWKAAP
jgi:hypothetical protein